jgi:phytoene dehydrogenase-like protein
MADMSFDVVCVGAGNKNLAFACYATKYGGLTVGMFEDRHEAGAGWSSEESPAPGFIANHCSHVHADKCYHFLLFEDFPEIDQMVERTMPPLSIACTFLDDDTWIGRYSDKHDPTQEKTAKSIARFSERDAETWLWFWDKYTTYWEPAWLEASWSPTKSWGDLDALDMLTFNPDSGFNPAWLFMSPAQVMADLFESVEAQMLGLRLCQSAGPMADETGLGIVTLFMLGLFDIIVIRGGNHSLAHACSRVIQQNGGKIFTNSRVDKILIENGRAKGVRLADGTEVEAKIAVVSNASPQQLVLELTDPEHWHPSITRKVKNIQDHMTTITWYTWALHEQPKYKAEAFDTDIHDAAWTSLCRKDVNYALNEVRRRRLGLWPDPENMNLVIGNSSIHDPTYAPPGKACAITEEFVLPATACTEQEWKEFEKQHADEVISFWQKAAPNMNWDNVVGYVPVTPHFTAKHARNYAPSGNWAIIDLCASQVGKMRPIPELANITKFPISNLYPCSAAWTWQVGGGSHVGYIVYKVMADQFGLRKPWEEKRRPY